MRDSLRPSVATILVLVLVAVAASGQNVLNSGPGPGTVSLRTDAWGNFAACTNDQVNHGDALFTNAAGAGPFATVCFSAIVLSDPTGCTAPGNVLLALTDALYTQFPGQSTNPAVSTIVPNRHIQTAPQTVCGLSIAIDQRLEGPNPSATAPESSTLVQTYTVTNPGPNTRTFNLIHFLDGDLGGTTYLNNRAGASRRLADCNLSTPPFVSNKEWIFEYDFQDVPGLVLGTSAEGIDANGLPTQTSAFRVHASPIGHPNPAFVASPVGFLTNAIDNDTDGDLLVTSPEATGDFALFQGLSYTVPPGGSIIAAFRTRWSSMNPAAAATADVQAREITCRGWKGSPTAGSAGPLLCVNGQSQCASIPSGTTITINLAAPPAGPAQAHYIVYGIIGQPAVGAGCGGSPQAGDFALWGPPIGNFGFAAFPVSASTGAWTGGGAAPGLALISSLAGVAPFTGPIASGSPAGCGGNTIFSLPGILPGGFSITFQGVILDNAATPLPVSVTNAVNLTIGPGCPCQIH